MSEFKTMKCPACGWCHAAIPLADAEKSVRDGNAYQASKGEPENVSIDWYLKCFRCGAPTSNFVPAMPGDVPPLATLQPVVVPDKENGS